MYSVGSLTSWLGSDRVQSSRGGRWRSLFQMEQTTSGSDFRSSRQDEDKTKGKDVGRFL